ncbi:hypothetical protein [Gluconobacter kondonii]|uniref:hypothetical protein n=1 Tax=Gluconobacter kondonii TaxID=941463 RepID=UPI001B8BF814|nr:hypothetical protein [Gluconobacter kondonii]MBS1080856.1 hypothetical protein [Gluconobacter kondonii]
MKMTSDQGKILALEMITARMIAFIAKQNDAGSEWVKREMQAVLDGIASLEELSGRDLEYLKKTASRTVNSVSISAQTLLDGRPSCFFKIDGE